MRLVGGEPGTPKRQGRYVLGDLLGRGGMAEVFSGHAMGSHGFQKPVAIKRLLPELANDHVFVERLIGEAKLLVGMAHGNIVSVLDLARDGEDVFLVMEFIDGPSLRQLLKARGKIGLPLAITAYIVQSAAAGLEYAHGRHIIHADISPSNLLLTTSGEVRVADFGIARREGNGAGVVEGKWAYMAPEQARGEPLTPRSDVFALGVVLYELVTGQHPLGRQITADERESGPMRVVPPCVVKPGLPAGIDQICMKALAHDPRDRYASMKQLADALMDERFANGWREGASELAQLIRECNGTAEPVPERRTQHTDRPVTIVTRSLISSSKPSVTPPNEAAWAEPIPTRPSKPSALREPDSLEQTSERRISRPILPPDASIPQAVLAWVEAPALVTPAEMASVHGGSTVTGSSQISLAEKGSRWQLGVLGVAALVGIGAAIAIQIAPDHANKAEAAPAAPAQLASASVAVEPAPVAVAPTPQPALQVVQVPVPVPVETPAP
ncbi:MAG TPA: serine/threonine-protein kinase, partial [Kofleriaceae bacterium]|nr:serine/threonine-protein kinase [Kofleriaceae bacterium]